MGSIGSYATNRGIAQSALAQGRAAREAAYVNAANTEAESASALRLAAENMATARRNQTAATASVRAARGASGLPAEGSGLKAELTTAEILEKQISDMSLGAAINDQGKRHEAAMQRWEGDAALVSAQNQAAAYRSAANGALVSTGIQLGGALIGGIGAGMGAFGSTTAAQGAFAGFNLGGLAGSVFPGSTADSRMGMMELGSWAASPAKSDFSFYSYAQKFNPFLR
ncbi:hypothetical protein [Akkermansia sp. BIOML-A32]|uniref:hypothetical protein n=1 Tax=Akkermansia sp. BIOML-A32 TaxID=2584588 RepID=UPI00122F077D|nr:hypothetical protein [Akkermansia sp. BIOML-A32]KAA3233377.1 hypothetical protein F1962_12130 [Akkermansia sp. BIOML-A32]